jgi:nucleoside 2-deoxyribosyltransferase
MSNTSVFSSVVYLSGPITKDPYCSSWRQDTEKWFHDRNIRTLNPLRETYLSKIGELGLGGAEPSCLVVKRDLIDIQKSNALLINLLYIPERQCVGSFIEVGFAVAKGIPFVVVTTSDTLLRHSFVKHLPIKIESTLEEGMESVRFLLS